MTQSRIEQGVASFRKKAPGAAVHAEGEPAGAHPVFALEVITPTQAQEMLQRKRPGALINKAAVRIYSQTMQRGAWKLNGMPIVEADDGTIIDGVQRLQACAESGVAFKTIVARNVDKNLVHSIDQQRRRSYAGVLESRGEQHAQVLQNSLQKLIRYDDDAMSRSNFQIPWSRLDRALEANPDLRQAVKFAMEHPARALNEATRAPLTFMGFRVDPFKLHQFLDAVANPQKYEATEPGALIRARIEQEKGKMHRTRPVEMLAICIKALNDTISGTRHRYYTWIDKATGSKNGEAFPKLTGYMGLSWPEDTESVSDAETMRHEIMDFEHDFGEFPMRMETITPEKAVEYLQHNEKNRKIVRSHVEMIARDIKGGRWMLNVQPICFSKSGRLLNGQHRLTACIEAGQPIEVAVMRGLDDDVYATYDIHAKKSANTSDLVGGGGDRTIVNAAAKLLWALELKPETGAPNPKPSVGEIREILERHPGLIEMRHFGRRNSHMARASLLTYIGYKIMREDPQYGKIFLQRMEDGAELPAKHPILELRNRLNRNQAASKRTDLSVVMDEIMNTWHRFRADPGIRIATDETASVH